MCLLAGIWTCSTRCWAGKNHKRDPGASPRDFLRLGPLKEGGKEGFGFPSCQGGGFMIKWREIKAFPFGEGGIGFGASEPNPMTDEVGGKAAAIPVGIALTRP